MCRTKTCKIGTERKQIVFGKQKKDTSRWIPEKAHKTDKIIWLVRQNIVEKDEKNKAAFILDNFKMRAYEWSWNRLEGCDDYRPNYGDLCVYLSRNTAIKN